MAAAIFLGLALVAVAVREAAKLEDLNQDTVRTIGFFFVVFAVYDLIRLFG